MQPDEFLSYEVNQLIQSHANNDNNQNWSKSVIFYMYLQNTVSLAYIIRMTRDAIPYLLTRGG